MPGYLGSPAYLTKHVAGFAAADADETLTAPATLVDGVRNQRCAALECLAHTRQIDRGGLMAEPVPALLAGTRTVPSAGRRYVAAADYAAALTITRTLTHGRGAGRDHGWSSGGRCLGESLAR